MNARKIPKPESHYTLDKNMSLDKINRAKNNGNFLSAKVLNFDSRKNCIIVDLGNNFKGEIPLNDFSIYPVTRANDRLSASVYSLIGKNICACVKEIYDNNTIILSRKANMIKALNRIKSLEGETISCTITSMNEYGLFLDSGHGITGLLHISRLISTKVKSPSDVGFSVGESIKAKIYSVDCKTRRVELSYKDLFSNLAHELNTGDVIEAISLFPVNESESGYYAYVNPNTPALVNAPKHRESKIPYGSKIVAAVRAYSSNYPDKLRLDFISFIH